MVGFRAEAVTDKLTINTSEIETAAWFSRKQIQQFDSIAITAAQIIDFERLIDEWLQRGISPPGLLRRGLPSCAACFVWPKIR